MIFDVHAHYDDEAFNEDRDILLNKLFSNNVCGIVNATTDENSQNISLDFTKKYDNMWTTIGYHPECSQSVPKNYLELMNERLKDEKAVAIGEIGLDYYWKDVPKEEQMPLFENQLKLSKDLDMPVVIHNREAHLDIMTMLKKYKPKGIVHCFSGSVEMSREIMKLGMYISLGGVVTFKNARHSIEVVKDMPIERLLLETDAPYLSPVPFRGKRCDSSMISLVAEKIAEIKGISVEKVLEITCANAKEVYNLK